MSGIDWNTELRRLEREFDGLPPEPTPEERAAQIAALRAEEQRREQQATTIAVWARLLLVAALVGALPLWPYDRACGFGLIGYLAAGAVIVVGGVWVTVWTWRTHKALAHCIALALILSGLILVGHPVLERIGYARTDPTNPPQWWCRRW
jgi:hypothetical protein